MHTCPKCGHTDADNAVSCSRCGTVFTGEQASRASQSPVEPDNIENTTPPGEENPDICRQCGEQLLPGGRFCAYCGRARPGVPQWQEEMVPVSSVYYNGQEEYSPQKQDKPKISKRMLLGAAVAAALCLAVGVWSAYRSQTREVSGTHTLNEQAIVYVRGEESLRYKNSLLEKAQVITDTFDTRSYNKGELVNRSQIMSRDGRYLLYLNDYNSGDHSVNERGDLYLRDLTVRIGEGEPTDKGEKIASDVTMEYYFSDDERYIFYIDAKKDLYIYDFSERYKLDGDVTGILDWNENKILYYKGTEVDAYTSYVTDRDFYLGSMKQGERQSLVKLDSNINDLWDWTDDFSKFIYTKTSRNTKGSQISFDVFWFDVNADTRETLITDVDDVVEGNAEDGTLLYLLSRSSTLALEDIFEDDMLREDAAMRVPNLDDFPLADLYYNSYEWMYDSSIDMEAMLEERDRYDKLVRAYEAKLQRDKLRAQMEEDIALRTDYDIWYYDLYYLADGVRNRLDTGLYQAGYSENSTVTGNIKEGFAYYVKLDLGSTEKMKMSEMTGSLELFTFDAQAYMEDHVDWNLFFTYLDGSPMQLNTSETKGVPSTQNLMVTEGNDGIYYLTQREDAYWYALYYVPLANRVAGKPQLVEESVEDFYFEERFDGKYFYTADTNSGSYGKGDLYTVSEGKPDRIIFDVSTWDYVTARDGKLLFYQDYNSTSEMGNLYIQGAEKTLIADDVYDFYYRGQNMIYLLRNYRAGKGDLYLYNGTPDLELIDYDVTLVMEPWIDLEAAS